MRKLTLVAGLLAAAAIPSFASAQTSCRQQHDNQVVGTLGGAGAGALVGSSLAGRGDRGAGAVIGAVGGAIIANQLTRPDVDCTHAYGYYDGGGMWHTNNVSHADARGYYDRGGVWVDGAPNGYYATDGRWVAGGQGSANGYYDSRDRWVPASAQGYYDSDGQLVAGSASGHYGANREWVAGPANGAYNSDGQWMPGASNGHRDAAGDWVVDAQPGYYDSGHRWRAGAVAGYYDGGGRWISTSATPDRAMRFDTVQREAWLDKRIRAGRDDGTVSHRDARMALQTLGDIRRDDANKRRDGELNGRDEASIQGRLDRLTASLRWTQAAVQPAYN